MDFNDSRTCKGIGSGVCSTDSSFNQNWTSEMRRAAATAGAYPLSNGSDRPHLECRGAAPANVPNNGLANNSSVSALGNLGQGLSNLFTPPQPNPAAQALAQQSVAAQSPFSAAQVYATPAPVSSGLVTSPAVTTPVSSSLGSVTNGNTNTNTNTGISAIDLINAMAYPSSTIPITGTGTVVALNNALSNPAVLQGIPSTTTGGTIAYAQTSSLSPNGQTFTSPDMSKNSVSAYAPGSASTFGILENLKQTLLLVLQWLKPFGGSLPKVATNSTTAVLR